MCERNAGVQISSGSTWSYICGNIDQSTDHSLEYLPDWPSEKENNHIPSICQWVLRNRPSKMRAALCIWLIPTGLFATFDIQFKNTSGFWTQMSCSSGERLLLFSATKHYGHVISVLFSSVCYFLYLRYSVPSSTWLHNTYNPKMARNTFFRKPTFWFPDTKHRESMNKVAYFCNIVKSSHFFFPLRLRGPESSINREADTPVSWCSFEDGISLVILFVPKKK